MILCNEWDLAAEILCTKIQVFKGQLEDKTYVAVKWLAFKSKEDMNEYKTQAEVLSKLRHRHLVSVLGYCTEEMSTKVGDEELKSYCLFIVSDFVEQGDLRSHLRSKFNSPNIPHILIDVGQCSSKAALKNL